MVSELLNRVYYSNYLCARLFSSNVLIFIALLAYGTLYLLLSEMLVVCIFFKKSLNELYLTMVNVFDVNNRSTWACACVNCRMWQKSFYPELAV